MILSQASKRTVDQKLSQSFFFLTYPSQATRNYPKQLMLPETPREMEPSFQVQDQICQRFSLDQIRSATQDFNEALVVGHGGFGKVYKGQINDGSDTVVAIKRSNSTSNQGATEFQAEIQMLSKVRHCNLVSLIGYCYEGTEMALVYEYMPEGTLEDHLHKAGTRLSWLQLLKICIGAARGLDYLHTGTGTQHGIIHRDVKSSNVLLDKNFAAKISDFGLAKISPTNQTRTHVSTMVKGTFGYLDPRYVYTGELTRKSDVYSFGVVLLEVICGRPAVDTSLDEDQWGLAPWAQDRIKEGKRNHIVDLRLRGQISSNCLKGFVRIASECLHNQPNQRPKMAEIVSRLEVLLSLQERDGSSIAEGKLKGKVWSYFQGRVESKDTEGKNTSKLLLPSPQLPRSQAEGNFKSISMGNGNHLQEFALQTIIDSTDNFSDDHQIGVGCFGSAYHATINGRKVAVKRAKLSSPSLCKGGINKRQEDPNNAFVNELEFQSRVNHKNLVQLLGFCKENNELVLVYEYMENGSLHDHIHNIYSSYIMSWATRIKVALDAARGLQYLHVYADPPIIHGDIKSSNILLDSEWTGKVSDYGVSLMGPPEDGSQLSLHPAGMAPEYYRLEKLTTKSDVYSFGVVLLELLSGNQAIHKDEGEEWRNVVDSVVPCIVQDEIHLVLDHKMPPPTPFEIEAVAYVGYMAADCVTFEGKDRPTMSELVTCLELALAACLTTPSFSRTSSGSS